MVDPSVKGNLLIDVDGNIQLIKEDPAFLLGKNYVRPAIESVVNLTSKVFTSIIDGLTFLDRLSTQALTLPGASAQGIPIMSNGPSAYGDVTVYSTTTYGNSMDFEGYYGKYGHSADASEVFAEAKDFSKLYNRVVLLKRNINTFSIEIAGTFEFVADKLYQYKTTSIRLLKEINGIVAGITENKEGYRFKELTSLELMFPKCEIHDNPSEAGLGHFILVTKGSFKKEGKDLLTRDDDQNQKGGKPNLSLIADEIKRRILNNGQASLKLLNIDFKKNPYNVKQFVNLFTEAAVTEMEEALRVEMDSIRSDVELQQKEQYLSQFCASQDGIHFQIKQRIDAIYKKHASIINENKSSGYYLWGVVKENDQVVGWQVHQPGLFGTQIFEFKIRKEHIIT